MPIFRKDDVTVLFIHVPKTGGTSVEVLFERSGWEVTLLDRNGPDTFNRHYRSSPQHMHAPVLAERLRLQTFDLVFMTVREPLARFQSEVVMRNPTLSEPWSDRADTFAAAALKRYAEDPYVYDNHLRPQHEFYLAGAQVYRLEDGLDRAVAHLRETHGLDLEKPVPHNRARPGAMPGREVAVPAHFRVRLLDLYRKDYLRFGYPVPAE